MSQAIVNFMQSLGKSEKRYIHLYLKTFSGHETVNLNDFLEIEKHLHKKKYEPSLKGNTTRLYYKLLDILTEYHRENLNNNNIDYVNLNRAKLLFHKGLPTEAEKLINKILENPSGDNHLVKIEAIELRLIHAINTGQINYLSSHFENDKTLLKKISEEYTNLINYEILWAAAKFETTSGYFFDDTSQLSKEQYTTYLTDESNAISPMAKILFHKLKGYESIKNQNIDKAFEHTEKAIAIFQQHPGLIQANTVEYLKSIRNYAIALNFKKQTKKALNYISHIENITDKHILSKSNPIKIESYILFVLMKMDLMINGQILNEHQSQFSSFEKRFQEMRDILPPDEAMTSSFLFIIFHLHSDTPRKAIRYINYIAKHAGQIRKDLFRLTMLAELVTHFRLANVDVLESKLNSYKKYILKHGIIFKFEKAIPSLLVNIINEPETKSHYTQIINTVNKGLKEENKEIYLQYNPFLYLKK